ncbi:MAG: hypothetical protein ABSE46_19670 [Terracidiphilus sp.]|jgi:hypothetical protein
MPTRILAPFARPLASRWLFSRAALILLLVAAPFVNLQLDSQSPWPIKVPVESVLTKSSKTLCVAHSHDGGFAAVYAAPNCNEQSFPEFLEGQENNHDLFTPAASKSIPCVLRVPGILKMHDAGGGIVFFTADGVNDLVAIDLNTVTLAPIFLHTRLQATDLAHQGSTLWISGSKGITTLDLSKPGPLAWESDLQKAPIQQGAFGEWSSSAPPTSLLVLDAATRDPLLPMLSPASLVVDGGEKPVKKPTPLKITLTNPYGKDNPLIFQLHSWCDPTSKILKPACKPAIKGLTQWSVTSPDGANSCKLVNPKTDGATAEITHTGTVTDHCILEVKVSAAADAHLTIGVNKPKLAADKSTIEISFCGLGADNSTCQ